jgi:hypothetical protein
MYGATQPSVMTDMKTAVQIGRQQNIARFSIDANSAY